MLLIKAGLGSALAIFLANRFNLLYSVSAGIITLLTIQNTRKETLTIAFKRIIGFVIAILLAFTIFNSIGYTVLAFGLFIFIFTAISNLFNLEVGITVNAVLVTHILLEEMMTLPLIINEGLLLLIGMITGILVNSIMPSNKAKIKRDQQVVEEGIRNNLRCLADILDKDSQCKKTNEDYTTNFKELNEMINDLLAKAYNDAGNTFINETRYQISYLEMRIIQVRILMDIFESLEDVDVILPQSMEISRYVNKVAEEFAERNNVSELISDLDKLYNYFRNAPLPKSRNEFEQRAVLFNVLRDLEHFLQVKRSFIEKI